MKTRPRQENGAAGQLLMHNMDINFVLLIFSQLTSQFQSSRPLTNDSGYGLTTSSKSGRWLCCAWQAMFRTVLRLKITCG